MSRKNLAAPSTRYLLCEIANLRDNDVAAGLRLGKKMKGMMSAMLEISPDDLNHPERVKRGLPPTPEAFEWVTKWDKQCYERLLPLRNELREIWTERDPMAKRYAILSLAVSSWFVPKDGVQPFSRLLEYLLRPNVRTAFCSNSDCLTPYFFPKGRQKVCSEECARPLKREAKLRYWNKTGRANREKKRARKSSRRKQS